MIRPIAAHASNNTDRNNNINNDVGMIDEKDHDLPIIKVIRSNGNSPRNDDGHEQEDYSNGGCNEGQIQSVLLFLLGAAAILAAISATSSSIFSFSANDYYRYTTIESRIDHYEKQEDRNVLRRRLSSAKNQHQFETATVHTVGGSISGSSSGSSSSSSSTSSSSSSLLSKEAEQEEQDDPTKYEYQTTFHYTSPKVTNDEKKKVYEAFDPQIAWLASYPNSGTSFTLTMVARATNTTFATNYGLEANYGSRDTPSLPIYDRHPEGPFMPDPVTSFHHRQLPYGRYVITKTHCGGYCVNCGPKDYAYGYYEGNEDGDSTNNSTTYSSSSPLPFLEDCASGHGIDGHQNMVDVSYPPERVSRVIHMIRNPFHNAIARFHLERKHHHDANTTKDRIWLDEHPDDGFGINKFCQELDDSRRSEENDFFASDFFVRRPLPPDEEDAELAFTRRNGGKSDHHQLSTSPNSPSSSLSYDSTDDEIVAARKEWMDIVENVPCRGDFFRYVQWHNNLHRSLEYLPYKLPVLSLYYEDYQDETFMDTAHAVLDFLKLKAVPGDKRGNIKWAKFESRTDYDGFFTKKQKEYIEKFLYTLSSYQVWGEIQHYF